jgi:uncharacterized SAM-binding protein YcdF (DUF218 family)
MLKISKRERYAIFIMLLSLTLAGIFLIPFAGRYVIQSDVLQRSDVIVGLMGSVPERSIHTADLYHQGIAPRIILVEDDREPWLPLLAKGVQIDSEAEQFKDVCIQLGVPADSILILPGSAKSTRDEALILHNWLSSFPEMDTLTLTTSSFHTRRAALIFRTIMKDSARPVTVQVSPSPYSLYTPDKWWTDREKIQRVFYEWTKMVAFVLFE